MPAFDDFIDQLRATLAEELPGEKAQYLLAPRVRPRNLVDSARESARIGAVLVLYYPGGDGTPMLPLILRSDYDGTHGGQVALPGGEREKADQSIEATAIRETREEIGVKQEVKTIGRLSDLYIPPSNFLVTPVVAYCEQPPGFKPDPTEVQQIYQLSNRELVDKVRNPAFEDITLASGQRLRAPCFYIDEQMVWGATAMILSELVVALAT